VRGREPLTLVRLKYQTCPCLDHKGFFYAIMTIQELQKAINLNNKIEAKRQQLFLFERCKVKNVTFKKERDDESGFDEIIIEEIPKGVIKNAAIEYIKADLADLQRQFDSFLSPKSVEMNVLELGQTA
jgi:hypothetical protein